MRKKAIRVGETCNEAKKGEKSSLRSFNYFEAEPTNKRHNIFKCCHTLMVDEVPQVCEAMKAVFPIHMDRKTATL